VKNDYGTEEEAWALNGLEEPLKKVTLSKQLSERELEMNHVLTFPLALQPNSCLGRLHEIFRFTSVTTSRTVSRTPWTGDQLVARTLYLYTNTEKRTQQKH
jgi:hypothetical protein